MYNFLYPFLAGLYVNGGSLYVSSRNRQGEWRPVNDVIGPVNAVLPPLDCHAMKLGLWVSTSIMYDVRCTVYDRIKMKINSTYNNYLLIILGRHIFAASSSKEYENLLRFAPIVNQNLNITVQDKLAQRSCWSISLHFI